jgi:hypothetical protein
VRVVEWSRTHEGHFRIDLQQHCLPIEIVPLLVEQICGDVLDNPIVRHEQERDNRADLGDPGGGNWSTGSAAGSRSLSFRASPGRGTLQ